MNCRKRRPSLYSFPIGTFVGAYVAMEKPVGLLLQLYGCGCVIYLTMPDCYRTRVG